MFLTPEELFRLTGRRRYKAQCAMLDVLGIRYRQSAKGEPLVREADLDTPSRPARNTGPRWDLISS